jgi:hypothetical protein
MNFSWWLDIESELYEDKEPTTLSALQNEAVLQAENDTRSLNDETESPSQREMDDLDQELSKIVLSSMEERLHEKKMTVLDVPLPILPGSSDFTGPSGSVKYNILMKRKNKPTVR